MDNGKTYAFCSVSELKKNRKITRWIDELKDEISAFYVDDQIRVMSTVCPHFGGEFDLDEEKCLLRCRWHGWKFDLKSGKSLTKWEDYKDRNDSLIRKILKRGKGEPLGCFPYKGKLTQYEFKIQNDTLEVIIP